MKLLDIMVSELGGEVEAMPQKKTKEALSTIAFLPWFGGGRAEQTFADMDANVPVSIGMDTLVSTDVCMAFKRGLIAFPSIAQGVFQCRRLPLGHLAVT